MEDLILTCEEHKILKRFQKRLQYRYSVEINMPDTVTSTESDIIFASINGEKHNVEHVKKFLQEKISKSKETVKCAENVITITLSDSEASSESDESSILDEPIHPKISPKYIENISSNSKEETCHLKLKDNSVLLLDDQLMCPKIPSESVEESSFSNLEEEISKSESKENSVLILGEVQHPEISSKYVGESSLTNLQEVMSKLESSDNSVIIEEVRHTEIPSNYVRDSSLSNPLKDSVYVIELPENYAAETGRIVQYAGNVCKRKKRCKERRLKNKKVRSNGIPSLQRVEVCEVSSTTEDVVSEKQKFPREEIPEFIPLFEERNSLKYGKNVHGNISEKEKESDVVVLKDPLPAVGPLRPIVIDGSNVAIEHGKISHAFSAKGIKLAIDYFLDRGHTQVTAFVPKFRRNGNPLRRFPTTDVEILDELEKKQLVVFTPSRRVNGKCIASYDDRFIIDLASQNGGIIVSNDNYRDLMEESDSFKEAIEKRLLMFCFVGDIFMIPSDPLGRDGPSLREFLSFPPDEKT